MNIKKTTGIVLLGAMLSVGLSSCQFTNKYKKPDIDSEALFRDKNTTDTTSIANIPWQQYFSDPILQGLIKEALNNNHDMLATLQTIKMAEAGLSMARAAYFPNVALVANADYTKLSVDSKTGQKHVLGGDLNKKYMVGIAATWEADVWGRMNRESRAKYAQFMQSHAARNMVQTSLISNLASSYYALMALDEQLRITKETVHLLEDTKETMEALKEAGMLNGAAVEQSKGLMYGTMVNIPELESQIKELENTISFLLGRKPGSVNRGALGAQSVPQEMKVGVPVQMLSKRPDVMLAELEFRSAFELKQAARASFYPTISISTGTIGYASNTLTQFFRPENILANVVGGLTQPLFARKQLISNLKIKDAQQEEALIRFRQSVLTASKEVSDIVYSYESSLRKNDSRNKQVTSMSTAVMFTKELLKAGEANYVEVLNAEQSLLQAQLGQVGDKLEQLQYSVNLYRALGGGVDEPVENN